MNKKITLFILSTSTLSMFSNNDNNASSITKNHVIGFVVGVTTTLARQYATQWISRQIKSYIKDHFSSNPKEVVAYLNPTNSGNNQSNPQNHLNKRMFNTEHIDSELKKCPIARNIYGIINIPFAPLLSYTITGIASRYTDEDTLQEFNQGLKIGNHIGSLAQCLYIANLCHPNFHAEGITIGIRTTFSC